MELTPREHEALLALRQTRQRLYIGLDHHGAQVTVAVARGQAIAERTKPGYAWVSTFVVAQDGLGYKDLLARLARDYPEVDPQHYAFVSEPSYAKPCSQFLLDRGFTRAQVLWVDTRQVGQFRKTHGLGAGKSDVDDARAMVALLYHAATHPAAPLRLFEVPPVDAEATLLADYAADHARLGEQLVGLQGMLVQLVMQVFPELRRLWGQAVRLPKPGGGTYEKNVLRLFDTLTPLRVLRTFGGPAAVAAAGFDQVWKAVGGSGLRKATIRELVELARHSAGLQEPGLLDRLALLVEEYDELSRRQQRYREKLDTLLASDPVLASLQALPTVNNVQLATLVGAMGDVKRFRNVDAVKRYLNVAPMPLSQSGDIDERGRPVQRFRLPANSYETVNGQRRLTYRAPGKQEVRGALYWVFEYLVKTQARNAEDPFVRYFKALEVTHRGQPRWLGRVRWKVLAKLVETVFYCLKRRCTYDPNQVSFNVQARIA